MSDYEMDMMNPAKGPKEKPMKDLGTTVIDCRDKPTFKAQVWEKMAGLKDRISHLENLYQPVELNAQDINRLEEATREQGERIKALEELVKSLSAMVQGNLAEALRNMSQSTGPKKTDG